jgi:probable phosphoglycerate mutase
MTKTAELYFDGAFRPSTQEMAAGAVIFDLRTKSTTTYPLKFTDVVPSNNTAEYRGAILALSTALQLGYTHVHLHGDSMLVICQLRYGIFYAMPDNKGKKKPSDCWVINKPHLAELNRQAVELVSQFQECNLTWIPRKENSLADKTAASLLPPL